jgi:hypothetical protein
MLKNGIDTYFAVSKMLKRRDPRGEIGCPSRFFSILLENFNRTDHIVTRKQFPYLVE